MTKLKAAVGAVLLVGLGTALMLELQSHTKRREEPRALPQEAEPAARPTQENPGLSNPLSPTADKGPSALRLAISNPPRPRLPAPRFGAQPDDLQITNVVARLIHGGEEFRLSRAQVEPYLDKSGRSAESLMAGLVATRDLALLREALEKYPNDALVNYGAAVLQSQSPEERQQRLDAFKQSAPDNPLPSYLSAFDHFNSGQTDQGVQDLEDAYGKRSFEDYRTGLFQNLETMYREAGYSAADASTITLATPIPYLSRLSQLGRQISDLAGAYAQGGDEQSAQASLQIGIDLGERLAQAPDFPIENLAGIRLQERLLQGIDPDRPYDANGLTVKDQLALLSQREQSLVELGQQALGPEDRANGRLWFPPRAEVQGPK